MAQGRTKLTMARVDPPMTSHSESDRPVSSVGASVARSPAIEPLPAAGGVDACCAAQVAAAGENGAGAGRGTAGRIDVAAGRAASGAA